MLSSWLPSSENTYPPRIHMGPCWALLPSDNGSAHEHVIIRGHTHCYLRLKYWWSHILLANTKPGDTPMFINRRSPMSTTGKRVDIGTPESTTHINWSSTPMNTIECYKQEGIMWHWLPSLDDRLHHHGNRFIFPCYSRRMESPDPRYSH